MKNLFPIDIDLDYNIRAKLNRVGNKGARWFAYLTVLATSKILVGLGLMFTLASKPIVEAAERLNPRKKVSPQEETVAEEPLEVSDSSVVDDAEFTEGGVFTDSYKTVQQPCCKH